MSGTQLGRLMGEVTAQPPVDVEFGAVVRRVERRQSRLRKTAGAAGVLALGVVIAVPTIWGVSDPHGDVTRSAPPRPSPAVAAAAWVETGSAPFHWSQPSSWKVIDTGVGDHSTPSNNDLQGPFITTEPLTRGCSPTSDGFECNTSQVLKHLPPDGVVVEVITSFSPVAFNGSAPPDDPGTVTAPNELCRTWGAADSFTASRAFGPSSAPEVLQLTGCLGAAAADSAAKELRLLLAGATDSDFPVQGRLSWRNPDDWTDLPPEPAGAAQAVAGAGAAQVFAPFCQPSGPTSQDIECDDAPALAAHVGGHLGKDGAFGWFSSLKPTSHPAQDASHLSTGHGRTTAPSSVCRKAGGTAGFVDTRHLGPADAGEWLTISGCLTSRNRASQQLELQQMLDSAVDRDVSGNP